MTSRKQALNDDSIGSLHRDRLIRYHRRRRNHSDYMRGRTSAEILDNLHRRHAS